MNRIPHLRSPHRHPRWLSAGLCGLLLAGASEAHSRPQQPPPQRPQPLQVSPAQGTVWLAASDRTLDSMRGGFDLGAGLVVSFGISRAVYVNGQLLTSTSFQLGDITRLTASQASALGQQIARQAQVVQNGPGNTVEPAAATVPLATYIQNTLNDQTLRNQTVIEATSSGLGVLRHLNLQATINQAIADAMAHR